MLLTKWDGYDWCYYTYRYDIKKKSLIKVMDDCNLITNDYNGRTVRSGRYALGIRQYHSDSSNDGYDLYEISDSLEVKKLLSLGDNVSATFKGDMLYYASFDVDYDYDEVSGEVYRCYRDGSNLELLGSFYFDYDIGYPRVYSFDETSCVISFEGYGTDYYVLDYSTGELVDYDSYYGYD